MGATIVSSKSQHVMMLYNRGVWFLDHEFSPVISLLPRMRPDSFLLWGNHCLGCPVMAPYYILVVCAGRRRRVATGMNRALAKRMGFQTTLGIQ
jgi:hypothetical protein